MATTEKVLSTDVYWEGLSLKYKLRKHGQYLAYDFIKDWKRRNPNIAGPIVINAHRRFGKSFLSVLLGLERAIKAPRQRVRIIAPTKLQGIGIFSEQWSEIMADCPPWIEHRQVGDQIKIFNCRWKNANRNADESVLYLHGSEANGGERLRGRGSDMIILDEPRDMVNLEYFLKNIIGWHLMKRKNPLMVIISTPPRTADHYLTATIIPDCRQKQRYFEMPISKDEDVSPEDLEFVLEVCGSKDSIAWQREAECQLLADPGALILYEWQRRENQCRVAGIPRCDLIFSAREKPEFYIPRTTIDAGFGDANGVLFWYFDYKEQKLVVLDEFFASQLNSSDLKESILQKEREHFNGAACLSELWRDGDISPQQRQDLWDFFQFRVTMADKVDKMAAIDSCNAGIAGGKIVIHERCKELLYQLRNAAFREGTQNFIRTERMGHCDLIASLVTAYRSFGRMSHWDPYPTVGTWIGQLFIPTDEEAQSDMALLDERTYHL